jgi:hypothetical protein
MEIPTFPIIDAFTADDVPAQAGNAHQRVDLHTLAIPKGSKIALAVKTVNGQGGTPTSPGSAQHIEIYWAFSNRSITATDAPFSLENKGSSKQCPVADSDQTTEADGTREDETGLINVTGRYLYVWYTSSGWATNAEVLLDVDLVVVD